MLEPIARLINKTLALDPRSVEILSNLNQKSIILEIKEFKFLPKIEISFEDQKLHLSKSKHGSLFYTNSQAQVPSTPIIISGPLIAFFMLLITKDSIQAGRFGLKVEGDIETGQKIQDLFMNLEIDWEEPLSKLTGDPIAYYIGRMFKSFKKRQRVFITDLTETTVEYLQEEIALIPSQFAFESFIQNIETLNDHIQRLDAKINLIEKKEHEIFREIQ